MNKPLRVALVMLVFSATLALAQGTLVHNRLRVISAGKQEEIDKIRREVPELLREYPDDPGVMFLNGILMEDGTKALGVFEQITREFPQCEWADDAQWRIVQYYALKRDTLRANRELSTYRRNYPMSEFLIHAADIVKATVGVAPTTHEVKKAPATTTEKPVEKTSEKPSEKPTTAVVTKPTPTSSSAHLLVESKPNSNSGVQASTPKGSTKPEIKPEAKTETKTTPKAENKPELKPDTKAEAKPVAKESPSASAAKKWGLQIGVYSTQQKAEAEAQKYKEARLRVDIVSRKTSDGEGYAVVIGNYSSRESAEKSKEVVQTQCQCTPYIIEK